MKLRLAAVLVLIASQVSAQSGLTDKITTLTLNNATPTCLAANGLRRAMTIDNTANSINIGFCETQGGNAACTPAIGTAPTMTVTANTFVYWPAGMAPRNQFCFIAASSTPSISIREGQ